MHQILIAIVFHALDMVTGIISALRKKDLQSAKMRDGLFKKLGFILCYVLAFLVDTQGQEIGLQIGVNILPVVVLYAITTEIVSIIENICRINPDMVPATLKAMFHITESEGKNGVSAADERDERA